MPIPWKTVTLVGTLATAASALLLYAVTLAPTVTPTDSGELIVAAAELGVAHPPGFPLWVLLAHTTTWLPWGSMAQRVNLSSALFAAAAVGLLFACVRVAARSLHPAPAATDREDLHTIAALSTALLFATSRTLWANATLTEVYALNTMLVLLTLLLVLLWRQSAAPRARLLDAAAFVFGLALGVHHVTVLLTAPGLALLASGRPGFRLGGRTLVRLLACGLAGSLIYLYLPIAAARQPAMNWGEPDTWQRIWWHVSGRQYHSYFVLAPADLFNEAGATVRRLARELGTAWFPVGLVVAAMGFAVAWRRDRSLSLGLALIVAANLLYGLTYVIAEDKDAYHLPAIAALLVAAGLGLDGAARWLAPQIGRAAALVALCLVPALAFASNWPYNNRAAFFVAHDYSRNLLASVEADGLLLTLDWQVCAPLLYMRHVERNRRDAVVIDINLMRRPWYIDYLRREYPAVMQRAAAESEAYLADLRAWEKDPAAFVRQPARTERIDRRFFDLLFALLQRHPAPVWVTQEIVVGRDPQHAKLSQWIAAERQPVPDGLLFRLYEDRSFHAPPARVIETRGLADGTLRYAPDDVVRMKILPVYVTMSYNRGRYLRLHGHRDQAATAYRDALALDPSFALAQRALIELNASPAGATPR